MSKNLLDIGGLSDTTGNTPEDLISVNDIIKELIADNGQETCRILGDFDDKTGDSIENLFKTLAEQEWKCCNSPTRIISLYKEYKNWNLNPDLIKAYKYIFDQIDKLIQIGINLDYIVPAYKCYKKYYGSIKINICKPGVNIEKELPTC